MLGIYQLVGILLFFAVLWSDYSTRKIPNYLVFLVLFWGLFWSVPLSQKIFGFVLPYMIFVPAWKGGKLAGGDVKFFMALGFSFGLANFIGIFACGGVLLGAMSLVQLFLHGELKNTLFRMFYKMPLTSGLSIPFGISFALSAMLFVVLEMQGLIPWIS